MTIESIRRIAKLKALSSEIEGKCTGITQVGRHACDKETDNDEIACWLLER